jgi:hypothetical protein
MYSLVECPRGLEPKQARRPVSPAGGHRGANLPLSSSTQSGLYRDFTPQVGWTSRPFRVHFSGPYPAALGSLWPLLRIRTASLVFGFSMLGRVRFPFPARVFPCNSNVFAIGRPFRVHFGTGDDPQAGPVLKAWSLQLTRGGSVRESSQYLERPCHARLTAGRCRVLSFRASGARWSCHRLRTAPRRGDPRYARRSSGESRHGLNGRWRRCEDADPNGDEGSEKTSCADLAGRQRDTRRVAAVRRQALGIVLALAVIEARLVVVAEAV